MVLVDPVLRKEASAAAVERLEFKRESWWHASLVIPVVFFAAVLSIWFALDHSWPEWDAAEHVRVSSLYADLLSNPRFSAHWLKELLATSHFYPYGVYVFNAVLKVVFGSGRWVDSLSLVSFDIVLTVSTYMITYRLVGNRIAAGIAATVINCFPFVIDLSHRSMLEFPTLAMTTLSLWVTVNWRTNPSVKNTFLLGLAVGTAAVCKQIAAFYLVGPFLVLGLECLVRRRYHDLLKLTGTGLIAAGMFFPWYLVNLHDLKSLLSEFQSALGERHPLYIFANAAGKYFTGIPEYMSIPLFVLFALSVFLVPRLLLTKLQIPFASALIGILLVCTLQSHLPDPRYVLNALILPALVVGTAAGFAFGKSYLSRVLQFAAVSIAVGVFLILNFTPYPFPPLSALGLSIARNGSNFGSLSPVPPGDIAGQEWIIATVKRHQPEGSFCKVNLMPSTRELNVHTLQAVARYLNANLELANFRRWTPVGDHVSYNPKEILFYDWHLLKTGKQGYPFNNDESAANYEKIRAYVCASGLFVLTEERQLADGSRLSLYRRKS